MKGCEKLKDWVDPIINHFWYCCRVAEGSVEELKVRFNFPLPSIFYFMSLQLIHRQLEVRKLWLVNGLLLGNHLDRGCKNS